MDVGNINNLMRGAIQEVLFAVLPILGAALIVGLIVAIFQAVTSIQEQTLTFLPKLIVILVLIGLIGGFLFSHLSIYTENLFAMIPAIAK